MKRKSEMRLLIFEYMTATGTGRDPASQHHGMYVEGRAMRDALMEDACELDIEAHTVSGNHPDPMLHEFASAAAGNQWDWIITIAPDSELAACHDLIAAAHRRSLGPTRDAIALTADKWRLAEHWREHSVPTPATTRRSPTPCECFPVVWKPCRGAGSSGVFLLESSLDVERVRALRNSDRELVSEEMLLQEFIPGQAASVAFLCGPRGYLPLAPCSQLLGGDGRFKYLGGELPLAADIAARAVQIATRAVQAVPGLHGFVGVDLILGEAEDGSRDYAIEINPRFTTSYIGLRKLAEFNIVEKMLKIAEGDELGVVRWKKALIRFTADGETSVWDRHRLNAGI